MTENLNWSKEIPKPIKRKNQMQTLKNNLSKAKELLNTGSYDEAISLYQDIQKEDSENKAVFMGLGKAYLEKEMWEESLYSFLRAEVLNPSVEVYLSIGILFYKKKNYRKSIEYYEKAEIQKSGMFEIYWNKALAYEKLKMLKEAVFSFIQAYETNPKSELARKIAPMALEAKLFQEAVRFYRILIQKEEHSLYYAELGLAYMELGNYEESKKAYQKAKELSKLSGKYPKIDDLTFDDFIDQYPDLENQIENTIQKIEKGMAEYHDYFDLGNMLFIKGDYQKSADHFKQARDIYVHKLLLRL